MFRYFFSIFHKFLRQSFWYLCIITYNVYLFNTLLVIYNNIFAFIPIFTNKNLFCNLNILCLYILFLFLLKGYSCSNADNISFKRKYFIWEHIRLRYRKLQTIHGETAITKVYETYPDEKESSDRNDKTVEYMNAGRNEKPKTMFVNASFCASLLYVGKFFSCKKI